jgi:hypothetical protein
MSRATGWLSPDILRQRHDLIFKGRISNEEENGDPKRIID